MRFTRRNAITGLAVLAGGAGVIGGTGAFSSVQAQRNVVLSTTGDSSALLAMEPNDNLGGSSSGVTGSEGGSTSGYSGDVTKYTNVNDGTLEVVINDLNYDATTRFENLIRVTNNGSQDVFVGIVDGGWGQDDDTQPVFDVRGWDADAGSNGNGSEVSVIGNPLQVPSGRSFAVTVQINLTGVTESDTPGFPNGVTVRADEYDWA